MLKISCVPISMIMGMFLQKISWFLIWGARLDGLSHGNHFLQCPGVTAETILSVMLEKPFEEFWVAERCRLSFALPEEPRGRKLHQCHGCLWFWWVTVSGSMGGFWEDPFVTVSLEDGRCGEVSGQIMVWKLGLETKDSTVPLPLWRALELRVMKLKKVPGWCVLPSMASLWSSSPLQRPVCLCCGAPVCQHCGWRWFTAHPRGENISLMCGCRTDAVREEKHLGVVVEQLGRQLDAVEHPSTLQIPAAFFSLCCFSSNSSCPSPAILRKGVWKDRMDYPFQSLLRNPNVTHPPMSLCLLKNQT